MDAYKTTIEDGKSEAQKYNLIVTVMDARSRYLKNTVFTGDVVYNKNNEDPAHFILRLNTLKKLMPTYDLAGSSDASIPQSAEKSTDSAKKVSENSRRASMDVADEFVSPTEGNVGLSRFEKADIKLGDKIKDTFTTTADKLYIDTVDELYGVENLTPTTFAYKKRDALNAISHSGEHSQKRSSLNMSISQSAEKSTASAKKVAEISAEGGKSIRKSKDITPKVAERERSRIFRRAQEKVASRAEKVRV